MRRHLQARLVLSALLASTFAIAQAPDWKALNEEAVALYRKAEYSQAAATAARALEAGTATLGADHPNVAALQLLVASTLNGLGSQRRADGQLEEAEQAFALSLALREKVRGPEHADVATSLNNLATVYRLRKKFAEAEPMYARALAIREKALGPNHAEVAVTLNNLAVLHDAQDRFEQAEPLYRRSLEIREQALGANHLDVAASLNSLGELYLAQRRFERAEPVLTRAFDIRSKALAEKDPDRLATQRNLWTLYMSTDRFALAEEYQQQGQVTPTEAQRRRMGSAIASPKGNDPTVRPR